MGPDWTWRERLRVLTKQRRDLLNAARQQDILMTEDSAYGFTASAELRIPSLKSLDSEGRVLHIGTFAKVGFPGARVGFLVADQAVRSSDGGTRLLAELLSVAKGVVTVNTSPVAQAVIGGMLLANGCSIRRLGEPKAACYRRNPHLPRNRPGLRAGHAPASRSRHLLANAARRPVRDCSLAGRR